MAAEAPKRPGLVGDLPITRKPLKTQIESFATHCNHDHESLSIRTAAGADSGMARPSRSEDSTKVASTAALSPVGDE